MVAAAMFASCDKAPVDDTPKEPATLKINERLVQANAVGGDYSFTYTLTNPDGNELKAECEADWVHSFDLSKEGEVKFTVDVNASSESRIVYVYLKYGKLKEKITVSQTGVNAGDIEYAFDISYEIDGPNVRMSVVPDPEGTRYYAWYYSKKGMETALEQSPGVDITMYLNRLVEVEMSNAIYYGAYAGFTAEEAVDQITLVGAASQDFVLNGCTDFYGFVCAVSNTGERLSDVVVSEFTTGAVAPSSNQISIVVDDINSDRFDYTIHTTNDDQYAVMVLSGAEAEGKSDEDILAMFNAIPEYLPYLHRNNYSYTALVSAADADYCILAFGFEYGMATTEVVRQMVHTLPADTTSVPEFSISIDKVTNFRIKATIEANPKTCLYFVDYCEADVTAEELKEAIHEAAQWYVDNGYYADLGACLKTIGYKGRKTFEFLPLMPQTDYRVYAIGINEITGEFTTDVIFTDVITTAEKVTSESYISIPFDDYFDGFDLAEAYPTEFADAEGWAVVPIEVTIHGDVMEYYYDIYMGDLSDTSYPTDDQIILDLEMYGVKNNPLSMLYCYFSEPLTLIYFSKDSDDNFSPVTRVPIFMLPEGATPVEEFKYGDAIAKQARSFVAQNDK